MSGNGTAINQSYVDIPRLELLLRVVTFNIVLSVISICGCLMIIAATLASDDMNDNRFYTILRHICACRALTCLNFLILGIFSCLRDSGMVSTVQSYLGCTILYFWLLHGTALEMVLLIFVAVDRFVSVTLPVRYWTLTSGQASLVCWLLPCVTVPVKVGPIFTMDMHALVPCTNIFSLSVSETVSFVVQLIDNILLGILIATHVLLMLFVHYTARMRVRTEAAAISIARHLSLIPILQKQVVLHCGLQVISKTVLLFSRLTPDPVVATRLALYGGIVVTVDIFVNTFVLLLGNRDMREATLNLIRRSASTPVVPI